MEEMKKSNKYFVAAIYCLIVHIILSMVVFVGIKYQLGIVHSSVLKEQSLLIPVLVFIVGICLKFFMLKKVKEGSYTAWLLILIFVVLSIIYSVLNEKINTFTLVGYVLATTFVILSRLILYSRDNEIYEARKKRREMKGIFKG